MKKLALLTVLGLMAMGTAYADIDNMNIGGDFMAEYFFAQHANTLSDKANDEGDFIRTEGHLWFQADLDDNIMARISLEFDRALDQSTNAYGQRTGAPGELQTWSGGNDLTIFLEEAFVKVKDIAGSGFSASVGRQFLNFGDDPNADNFNRWWGPGFILADGNPNSPLLLTDMGSYEIDPFDAIVLNYSTEAFSISLVYGRSFEDNSVNLYGENSDSAVTALYGSYFGFEGHQIDAYLLWADNNQVFTNEGNSYIFGARAAGDLMPELAYKVEFAYQTQDSEVKGPEIDAFAAQAGLNYHPDVNYKPNIGFIYTFLQGEQDKGFTSGFSSPFEGKTFGLLYEGLAKCYGLDADAAFNNTSVFNLNGGFEPMQNIAWTADLYYFMINDKFGWKNDDGGFEVDSQVDYKFNDNLTTFLGGGILFPGDATKDVLSAVNGFKSDEDAMFFRTGVKVKF